MLVLATARQAAEYEVDSTGLADIEPHPGAPLVPSDVRIRVFSGYRNFRVKGWF